MQGDDVDIIIQNDGTINALHEKLEELKSERFVA